MPAFVARKVTVLAILLGCSLAAHSAPPAASLESQRVTEAHQRYQRQKFGLFVHYVPALTVDPNTNQSVQDIDELANRFDVEQFARDAADFGVEYVIFTVHHFGARMLYPSAVNKRWRDDRRMPGSTHERNWKTYSDTDVIAPLADALKRRNIELHLYVHPVDGHDFSPEDQENTGWFECDSGHAKWNMFQNELFDELCERYATRIQGLWFDGMYAHNGRNSWHGCIDQPKFRETLLKHNPALILTANVAGVRDKNPCADWVAADYRAWEVGEITGEYGLVGLNPAAKQDNAFTWPGTKEQVALVVGGSWWASNKANNAKFSAADMYRYLVLQAALSDSGGLAVSAGCFPGTVAEQPNGTLWEGNVRERLVELNQRIAPVAESIKNTNASKVFVTEDHQWLEQKGWGVATDAPDGSATYLHVLRPPDSKTLVIGKPANGAHVRSASILPGGALVSLQGDATTGYTVSLPDGISWNDLDTVIKLEIEPPPNNPPVATARYVRATEDTPKPITLSATDADGNPLTYTIVTQPASGTLSGTPPNVTYTPAFHYNGVDRFTFKANDGLLDSAAATVSIIVASAPETPPVSGYSRWFDASQIDEVNGDRVTTWNDLSGNAAHATVPGDRNNAAPVYVANAGTESGLPAVYFAKNTSAANSAALSFTRDSAIRTVFSVFKGNGFLLTDSTAYHFHRPGDDNPADPLWLGWAASPNINGGSTYVNGTLVNGTTDAMPTNLHNGFNLVEVITTGNVQADSFNKDRADAHAGNQYQAEVIIYDRVLTELERLSVEAYLMGKWMTPPANNFANWADTNAPGQTPGQDHDNDGVENGIEYFMGQTGSSFTAMPGLDATNTVTWTKDPAYNGTWQIQTSPDLSTWTGVTGTDTTTSISCLLPPGEDKKFVRLLVTPAP
jgi:hypothetical protein